MSRGKRDARAAFGALLFDMDGVLMNTNPFHRRAWRKFCREMGRRVSEEELRRKVFGWRTEEGIANLWGLGGEAQIREMAARKEEIFRTLVADHIEPMRGLEGFLIRARASGLSLGLATSACRENVEMILDRLGIGGFFGAIVLAEEVGVGKPHPAVFLTAARQLGVKEERCLVIEDSISGVTAAKRAAMACAALTTTHRAAELFEAGADIACRDFTSRALKAFLWGESAGEDHGGIPGGR